MSQMCLKISIRFSILTGLIGLFFLVAVSDMFAQTDLRKPELRFQRIHEGLLSSKISAIHQDSYGYLWVGTHSGLHRYDGINFYIYTNSEDTASINNNTVEKIYEDRDNNLWIGTGGGISRYEKERDSFTNFELQSTIPKSSSGENIVNTILEDDSGTLWISGSGKELYYFDEERQNFVAYGDFSDKQITSMAYGGGNILWIATFDHGLKKFNTQTGTVETSYTHDPADPTSIASNDIYTLAMDRDGTLWAGTRGSGLDRLVIKDGKPEFRQYRHQPGNPHSLGNNDIFTLYIDRDGQLWVGNENGGLHLYNRRDDSFYLYENDPNNPHSLSHNSIWSIYQDREGRHWIGTGLAGLNVADPYASKFMYYGNSQTTMSELNSNIIRDFLETEDGDVLVATDGGGVNYFDREEGTFTAFKHDRDDPYSIGSDAIIDLSRDEDGNIWVGTWGGGLNMLVDQQEGRFISFQEKISDQRYQTQKVFDVHFDKQYNYIWVPAFGEGLYRYHRDTGTLDIFNPDPDNPNSLSSNYIFRIFEDSENNLWFATNNGVNLLKSEDKQKGAFKKFLHAEEDNSTIPSNSINQIFEDSSNNIWIATDNGLAKYIKREDGFITYRESDGLPSDEVKSIIEDDSGYLWVGTIKGISRVDPEYMSFRTYDKNDGLQGNEFSRYSVHKLSTGELLFGGMNGFNLFHPDSLKENPNVPPIYFTDFKLFNKSVNINDKDAPLKRNISVADTVTLTHDQSVFTFEFIALNYTKPEQNKYAFKMEGFEEDWNYVGNQRNATYTNLDPGTYTFRVIGSNNDGVWNENGTSTTVVVTPPFWQTTWFYLVSGLFVAGVVFIAYRWRVRSITRLNKRLEKEVEKRTSELDEKNKDLQGALQDLKSTRSELFKKAHKAGMADLATGVLHNIGNILNSVNISTTVIEETLRHSKIPKLRQANALLDEHKDNLEEFLLEDPRGMKLLNYYLKLEDPLGEEHQKLTTHCDRLIEKVQLMLEVIDAQQDFAKVGRINEKVRLEQVVNDTLTLQSGSIERHGLKIEKEFAATDKVIVQKSKLIHILINLFKNAKEAMADVHPDNKKIIIQTFRDEGNVILLIADKGIGIKDEDLNKVFNHGFTTKKSGHGFGLHTCANYMTEMGGTIGAASEGEGKGSTFKISFPRPKGESDKQKDYEEYDIEEI